MPDVYKRQGKKKLGIAEANKEAVIEALENVVSFDVNRESITWSEFVALDIIGNKQRRLMVYEAFNLGYGNVKTLFKRLNMVGITKEQVLGLSLIHISLIDFILFASA